MTDEQHHDHTSRDQVETASHDFGAPPVLALASFVLALLSLGGFSLLNGTTYVPAILNGEPNRSRLVIGLLVGAVLALLPVVLGRSAASRITRTDPSWAMVLARTAVLLGLGSLVLRLIVVALQATQDGPSGFARL